MILKINVSSVFIERKDNLKILFIDEDGNSVEATILPEAIEGLEREKKVAEEELKEFSESTERRLEDLSLLVV